MKTVIIAVACLTVGVFFHAEIKKTVTTKSAEAAQYAARVTSEQAAKLADATKSK